jgi:hypothetical protein
LSTPTRTLEAVHILQDSGISSQGTEALIKAVDLLQGARDYATKADVEAVRSDLRIARRDLKLWFLLWYIGTQAVIVAALLSTMAKGFKWI